MRGLPELWNKWEIQLMVLLSFILQVFLLLIGSIRRRKISGFVRVSIWLSYVGADSVAVFALGLLSHYEEKLRSQSFGDTLPFLWIPFLLVHLGGQDSITAFSIEDNNLWLRHLLNLGIQGSLALYIFWKSIQSIHGEVLVPAAFVFVSGIIKYGERIWALRSGSLNGLGKSSLNSEQLSMDNPRRNTSLYALQTVLCARGLLIGRTVLQLGDRIKRQIEHEFSRYGQLDYEVKLKIIMMELDMLFDLLYTKAMVLQSRAGRMFRYAAQISIVIAFLLFLTSERRHAQNHNKFNVAISYMLFVGAIFMEAFSVAMVIKSPWTRAHLNEGTFLHMLSGSSACSSFMPVSCKKIMHWLVPNSMGQFNHMYFIFHVTRSKLMCRVISALGLGEQWTNLCYVKHVEAQDIREYIVRWFHSSPNELLKQRLRHNRRLYYTLRQPFEHVLYRLHIFTDLHISTHFDDPRQYHSADVIRLKEDCEKLSNYMYYLKNVHPSMLPVSVAASDGKLNPGERQVRSRMEVLNDHVNQFVREDDSKSPFHAENTEVDLKRSLEDIKELWVRLLVYAAGKCGAELHVRQLANGGELLTFVWLLMLHRGLGDAATELNLLLSDGRNLPEVGSLVPAPDGWIQRLHGPHYAFDFRSVAGTSSDTTD